MKRQRPTPHNQAAIQRGPWKPHSIQNPLLRSHAAETTASSTPVFGPPSFSVTRLLILILHMTTQTKDYIFLSSLEAKGSYMIRFCPIGYIKKYPVCHMDVFSNSEQCVLFFTTPFFFFF